jgi:hypothetical protein
MSTEPGEIVNRVDRMGVETIDLELYFPEGERVVYDIKNDLWQGLALKEKDFREHIKTNNWEVYKDQHVAIVCSADAIVPTWAYMLLATALKAHASTVVFGDLETLENQLFMQSLTKLKLEDYRDKRVVIKGCGERAISDSVFVELTLRLEGLAKAIMYGEPCSTVPVYRKPR